MNRSARHASGFTLIELVVTLAVMFSFFVMAVPFFNSLRQRSALRGAAEHTLSLWNNARSEAVKRNQMVKVGVFRATDGSTMRTFTQLGLSEGFGTSLRSQRRWLS